ncbi:MAG: PQQ-binding-like beta-propeller repeat protein [Pseudomonadota bacterium]|nr:PQQ-binding-like beta-propeller repeat protein [Pseudomonadota bacterium]
MGTQIRTTLKALCVNVGLLLGCLPLVGCETARTILGTDKEPPPIPGKRISVLALEKSLEPDPESSALTIKLPRPTSNLQWAQTGGSATHSMGHPAADGSLARVWSIRFGKGETENNPLLAGPIVVNQMMFTLDAESNLSAIKLGAPKATWKKALVPKGEEMEGSVGGGLAYYQDTLYVTTAYGFVLGLNPENGGVYWWKNLGAPIRGAPVASDGRIFVLSVDNHLHVLSHSNGSTLWEHQGIIENAGLLGTAAVAISKNIVVVPYSSGELYAMRVENGRVVWSDSLIFQDRLGADTPLSDIDASPVIVDNTVYAGSNSGRLAAIDLRTGLPLWDQEIASSQTPWAAGDYLFVTTTENDLVCLNRITGKIHWISPMPKFSDPSDSKGRLVWTRPLLAGDRLITANNLGEMRAISPYSGKVLGQISLGAGVRISPIVARGTVYVVTGEAEAIALR